MKLRTYQLKLVLALKALNFIYIAPTLLCAVGMPFYLAYIFLTSYSGPHEAGFPHSMYESVPFTDFEKITSVVHLIGVVLIAISIIRNLAGLIKTNDSAWGYWLLSFVANVFLVAGFYLQMHIEAKDWYSGWFPVLLIIHIPLIGILICLLGIIDCLRRWH